MPANTPRGFPYPLPAEPVAEGAQAIRNLAEAVDAFLSELAYVEVTASVNVASGAPATPDTIISDVARVYEAKPIIVEFFAPVLTPAAAANAQCVIALWQDAAAIGLLGQFKNPNVASSNIQTAVYLRRRLTPAAGSHTYSIRGYVAGGTTSIGAGVGGSGAYMPMFLRIARAA